MRGTSFFLFLLISIALPREASAKEKASLFDAGKVVFGISYASTAAVGLPSAVGVVGRAIGYPYILARGISGHCKGSSFDEYMCHGQHASAALLLPVIGPILLTSIHARDSFLNPNGADYAWPVHVLAYTATAAQVTGIALMIVGKSRESDAGDRPVAEPTASVRPIVSVGMVGLGVSGSF